MNHRSRGVYILNFSFIAQKVWPVQTTGGNPTKGRIPKGDSIANGDSIHIYSGSINLAIINLVSTLQCLLCVYIYIYI